jgi:uncharacterized protein (TIGR03435 family)
MLQGGPGTTDPERITFLKVTLQGLLREAYGVEFDQMQIPVWISQEHYDLTAKVPPGTTKEQLKVMLQDLLQKRFKLAFHHLSKSFPVWEVAIAKGGVKLKENTDTKLEYIGDRHPAMPMDENGFARFPPGKYGIEVHRANGLNLLTARGIPLSMLLNQASLQLATWPETNFYSAARIVDKTGLTGKYDFKLEFAGAQTIGGALMLPVDPSGGSHFIEAMEKQLGLKLTKSTALLDVLVIDHAERVPTAN